MIISRETLSRAVVSVVSVGVVALCVGAPSAFGQSDLSRFRSDDLQVRVTDADRASAQSAVHVYKHAYFAHTPAGQRLRHQAANARSKPDDSQSSRNIAGDDFTQNPGDVTFQGGPTVQFAVSHAVYINPGGACTIASCWGNPERFLRDAGHSDFIHVLDQYVGLHMPDRYTLGQRAVLTAALPENPLSESDLVAILHGVVAQTGEGGYNNIYHLFLTPGTDTCFDAPNSNTNGGACYSPDNPATFAFCAYHDSVTYSDLGHVLFTVEPYQNVPGCQDSPTGAPNGQLADSTNDTLSHELFEAISDPDGDAWWNATDLVLFGNEIGDECIFLGSDGFTILPTFFLNEHLYRVQSEYSDAKHACAISPHQ